MIGEETQERIANNMQVSEFGAAVCLIVVGYVLVRRYLTCPEAFGRGRYKSGRLEAGSYARRQLDKIRAQSGHFPNPFPDGWYKIAESHQVHQGKVISVSALGKEFVIFRGENGHVGVIDAFCSHLGTHLGHGGQVVGNNIQCPYHLWEFDVDGVNKNIPYCKKDMSHSKRVNIKSYHSYESKDLKSIFFWYDSMDGEPRWPLHPGLVEIEAEIRKGKMRRACFNEWDDMLMHVFEPSQNSADYFHFQTVHQFLPMPFNLKLIKARHQIHTTYGQVDSKVLPPDCLLIQEKVESLRIFGIDALTLPAFIGESFNSTITMQGPTNLLFSIDTLIGRVRGHVSLLPLEPFRQKTSMVLYADNTVPWFVARMFHWWIQETLEQDRQVWEHKVHVAPRNLVAGDGPFAQFGRWLQQFYTEKSVSWDDFLGSKKATLEW